MEAGVTDCLRRIVSGAETDINLAEAALLLAKDEYPALNIGTYLERLDAFADAIRQRLSPVAATEERLVALNEYLFVEQGFAGNLDNYYDPRNSFLNEVLDRRLGIPITLSILYMEVGMRLGLPLEGVSFPGHFLVKFPTADGDVVLDPFSGGAPLSEEDLLERLEEAYGDTTVSPAALSQALAAADKKEILARVLRNLKAIYLQRQELDKALHVLNRILLIAPDTPIELRDRARLYEQMECFRPALEDYRRYLAVATGTPEAAELRRHIVALEHQVARIN